MFGSMSNRRGRPATGQGLLLLLYILLPIFNPVQLNPAYAQQADRQAGLPYLEINPLFSTASRQPTPLAEVLASVSVITRAEIERAGAYDVGELLAGQPGVEITRTGGPGKVQSIFLRGQNSKSLVVMVDGVRALNDNYGGLTVTSLPTSQIERVEIMRGTAGALYGEGAIGGVIHIFTRAGAGQPAAYADMRLGAYGTKEGHLAYGGVSGANQFTLSVSKYETDGFSAVDTSIKNFANPDRDGASRDALNTRYSRQISDRVRVGGFLRQIEASSAYDNFYASQASDRSETNQLETDNIDYGLFAEMRFANGWQSRLDVSQSELTKKDYQNGSQKSLASGGLQKGTMRRTALENQLQRPLFGGQQSLTAGIETVSSDYQSYGSRNFRDSQAVLAGWLGQFERYDLQVNMRRDEVEARDSSQSITNRANSWLVGAGWYLNQSLKLTASQSTAFRAPAGAELYGWGGNTVLKPETHLSTEWGLSYTTMDMFARLVRFDTRTKQAIVYTSSYVNLPDVYNKGWELYGEARLAGLRMTASHVWQKPINKRSGAGLLKRARQYGSLGASGKWRGFQSDVKWRYTGPTTDVGNARLKGYQLLDIKVSRGLGNQMTLALQIDNLLDKTYQNTYGYRAAGQSAFVSLAWRMGEKRR